MGRRGRGGGATTTTTTATVCAVVVTVSLLALSGRALADGAAGDVAPSAAVREGGDRPTRTIEDLAARVNATRGALAAKERRGRGLYDSWQQYGPSCWSHYDCGDGEYCDSFYGRNICRPCAFCEIDTGSTYPIDDTCPDKCYCGSFTPSNSPNYNSNCNGGANCKLYNVGSYPRHAYSSSVYMCEPYDVGSTCYEHKQCNWGDFCASSGGAMMNNFCTRCSNCEYEVSHNGVCPATCLGCDHLIDPEGYSFYGSCGAFQKRAEEHWCQEICFAWTEDDCCDPNPGVIAGVLVACVAGLTGILLLILRQCGCCCFNKRMGPRIMRAQPRFIMGQQPQFIMGQQPQFIMGQQPQYAMGQQPQYAMAPQAVAMQQPQYVVANARNAGNAGNAQRAQIAQALARAQAK